MTLPFPFMLAIAIAAFLPLLIMGSLQFDYRRRTDRTILNLRAGIDALRKMRDADAKSIELLRDLRTEDVSAIEKLESRLLRLIAKAEERIDEVRERVGNIESDSGESFTEVMTSIETIEKETDLVAETNHQQIATQDQRLSAMATAMQEVQSVIRFLYTRHESAATELQRQVYRVQDDGRHLFAQNENEMRQMKDNLQKIQKAVQYLVQKEGKTPNGSPGDTKTNPPRGETATLASTLSAFSFEPPAWLVGEDDYDGHEDVPLAKQA